MKWEKRETTFRTFLKTCFGGSFQAGWWVAWDKITKITGVNSVLAQKLSHAIDVASILRSLP